MTTIPNLNIVIQQGDAVRETHNIKNQALDTAQHTSFKRLEDEDKKRTMVSETEEADQILFQKEHPNEGRQRHHERSSDKRKEEEAREKPVDPDSPGRLLNTVV